MADSCCGSEPGLKVETWGTRSFGKLAKDKSRFPSGMTDKKGKNKDRNKSKSRSFALLRMTTSFFENLAVWDGDWGLGGECLAESLRSAAG
jgi:hypothetical protein